jgi:hypothetical protein
LIRRLGEMASPGRTSRVSVPPWNLRSFTMSMVCFYRGKQNPLYFCGSLCYQFSEYWDLSSLLGAGMELEASGEGKLLQPAHRQAKRSTHPTVTEARRRGSHSSSRASHRGLTPSPSGTRWDCALLPVQVKADQMTYSGQWDISRSDMPVTPNQIFRSEHFCLSVRAQRGDSVSAPILALPDGHLA